VIPSASRRCRRAWREVLEGEELAKSAEIGLLLAHFGALVHPAIENSQSHGALAFMAMEHGTGSERAGFLSVIRWPTGEKSKKSKVKSQKYRGGTWLDQVSR
jgi:hypothetical protein